MKFSVGYPINKTAGFADTVLKYRENIAEVYFSFGGFANGRGGKQSGSISELLYTENQLEDFNKLNDGDMRFNWLLNAACYGGESLSRSFFCNVGDTADFLKTRFRLDSVTTTSPLIARFFKDNFNDVDVRASVNTEIGSTDGAEYLKQYFDSFYLKRECNRDFAGIKKFKDWCNKNGKRLYGLANSGCLNFCSAHTFHDSLVAHENEIALRDNAYSFKGQCFPFLESETARESWLRITNFIRPEDALLYDDYFDGLKLATRVTDNPRRIIEAYCRGRFSGNTLELLEPNHAELFYPFVVENKRIPDDFAITVGKCGKSCDSCSYCKDTLKKATLKID